MMSRLNDLPMGFGDPVADSQSAFRAALRALSHPGETVECVAPAPAVAGLMPATVALLLALTDHETPVWWACGHPAPWLRFHTGAPAAQSANAAHFAVVAHALPPPELALLNAGTDESPERSTTLLLELPSLTGGRSALWSGPGLREPLAVSLAGLPPTFWSQWRDMHAMFPRGVDVLFIQGRHIVGLPRTTRVQAMEER